MEQKVNPAEKKELVLKIYAKVDELPTLPVVIPKLISLIEDPESSSAEVTSLISKDAALTAKILKVSNSAYYGFPHKISALDHAVALLGFNMVKSLAVSIGVVKTFSMDSKGLEESFQKGLWLHSLAVATTIQELGKRFAKDKKSDSLFVMGLLHDVGKLVYDQFFPELFSAVMSEGQNGDRHMYEIERELIGFDHAEVTGLILKRWKFPEFIIQAVRSHHSIGFRDKGDPVDEALLRVANSLAYEPEFEAFSDFSSPELQQDDLELLGLNQKKFDSMRTYVLEQEEKIKSFFHALF